MRYYYLLCLISFCTAFSWSVSNRWHPNCGDMITTSNCMSAESSILFLFLSLFVFDAVDDNSEMYLLLKVCYDFILCWNIFFISQGLQENAKNNMASGSWQGSINGVCFCNLWPSYYKTCFGQRWRLQTVHQQKLQSKLLFESLII